MATFNGQLRSNEIFAALYNMIISQQVFADNIAGTGSTLVDKARVDGTLIGSTKLYYSTDALKSVDWLDDAEAANLLALHRPAAPDVQAITIDQFRQIALTVDNYLSKRAWGTEGAFNEFNSVMLGWIGDTKRIYDATLYNTFIGTNQTNVGKQTQTITLPVETGNTEATNRLQAQAIATKMADLLVELTDISRDFNDYGHLRSYDASDLVVVWNSAAKNKIKKMDLPSLFHSEGLIDKFDEYTLPARYFGTVNATASTTAATNTTVRSRIETDYTITGGTVHVFPGDLLPGGVNYKANETYTEDATILFKIMHKNSVPYMSGFSVSTSFFNPKSLTENHYLTFGYNTLESLKNYPFITVKGTVASSGSGSSST